MGSDWPPRWRWSVEHSPRVIVIRGLHVFQAMCSFPEYRKIVFWLGGLRDSIVVLVHPDEQSDNLALLARTCGVQPWPASAEEAP